MNRLPAARPGTRQSKTWWRAFGAAWIFAGGIGLIQWMRWSCQSNWSLRAAMTHLGVAFAFAFGGSLTFP